MSRVGIVGNGSDKFTELGEERAKYEIQDALLENEATVMVSGHSPVGGIDIWSEEVANALGIDLDLKVPEVHQWNPVGAVGYRQRNLAIVADSDIVYVILADVYPHTYVGRRWESCYHHRPPATDHVKSGGCWTGKEAAKLGIPVVQVVVANY